MPRQRVGFSLENLSRAVEIIRPLLYPPKHVQMNEGDIVHLYHPKSYADSTHRYFPRIIVSVIEYCVSEFSMSGGDITQMDTF